METFQQSNLELETFFSFSLVLRVEPRALCILGKCFTTELVLGRPYNVFYWARQQLDSGYEGIQSPQTQTQSPQF